MNTSLQSNLFDAPVSRPPRVVQLRKEYEEALDEYEACDAHADESGEAIPSEVRRRLNRALDALRAEEVRLAALRA